MLFYDSQTQLSPTAQSALADITTHIQKCQSVCSRWYAGIATDPRQRLFTDHNVSEHGGTWIFRNAGSESGAREVEKRLLRKGCKGGCGGGKNPQSVYAYIITNATRE